MMKNGIFISEEKSDSTSLFSFPEDVRVFSMVLIYVKNKQCFHFES